MKIIRSFSRKLNLGGYETADFHCSAEDESFNPESDNDISNILYQFCRQEVEKSINEFLEERLEEKNSKKEVKEPTKEYDKPLFKLDEEKELKFDNVKLN